MHVERFVRVIEIGAERQVVAARGIAVRTHQVGAGNQLLLARQMTVLKIEVDAGQCCIAVRGRIAMRHDQTDARIFPKLLRDPENAEVFRFDVSVARLLNVEQCHAGSANATGQTDSAEDIDRQVVGRQSDPAREIGALITR